jgi:hypothetical protein
MKSIICETLVRPRSAPVSATACCHRGDRHAVVIHQPDVPQRRRHLLDVKFVRRAEIAALADIAQDVQRQIFFFEKQLEKQPIEPGVDVPVDEAKIVADDVIAIVGKLHGLPRRLLRRSPFIFPASSFRLTHDRADPAGP